MQLDPQISKRISIIKFLMIIGIVICHIPPYQQLSEIGYSSSETIKAFFGHGIFKAAVPVLAAISGFLLFYSGAHLHYGKLMVKKTRSIFIPLVLWNLPFAIIIYLAQKHNYYNNYIHLYPFELGNWLKVVIGTTIEPINYPLYFLRDLCVILLMSPVQWLMLKKIPYWGLAIVLVILFFDLDGKLIFRDTMLVAFYVGGLAATQKWDLTYLDRYQAILLFIFVAACIFVTMFRIENKDMFLILSPFLIWPALSGLVNTRVGNLLHSYSRYSFFLFLSHAPIMFVIYRVFNRLSFDIPYMVFWILAPVVTVLITIPVLNKIRHLFPNVSPIFLGGR